MSAKNLVRKGEGSVAEHEKVSTSSSCTKQSQIYQSNSSPHLPPTAANSTASKSGLVRRNSNVTASGQKIPAAAASTNPPGATTQHPSEAPSSLGHPVRDGTINSGNSQPVTTGSSSSLQQPVLNKKKKKEKKIALHLSACKYPVLRRVAKACSMNTIEEDDELDLVNFNIMWADTVIPLDRLSEFQPWQHFNHFPSMYTITRKLNLSITMGKMQKGLPDHFAFAPRSWSLKSEKQNFIKYFSGMTYANGAIVQQTNPASGSTASPALREEHESAHSLAPLQPYACSYSLQTNINAKEAAAAAVPITLNGPHATSGGNKMVSSKQVFIMKPNAGCQGKGIILTKDPLAEVDNPEDYVVQEYVSRPLLIDGRKFDLRVYCLVTSMKYPSIFVFNDGLVRLCAEAYEKPNSSNMDNVCKHLTNYAVNKKSAAYQLASAAGEDGSKRDFVWFNKWLDEVLTDEMLSKMHKSAKATATHPQQQQQQHDPQSSENNQGAPSSGTKNVENENKNERAPRSGASSTSSTPVPNMGRSLSGSATPVHAPIPTFPQQPSRSAQLWSAIDHIIVKTVLSAQPKVKHAYNNLFPHGNDGYTCFEVLGFDILIDHKLQPWLMEVNHTPSFATDSALDKRVKESLITEVLSVINPSTRDKQKSVERSKAAVLSRINGNNAASAIAGYGYGGDGNDGVPLSAASAGGGLGTTEYHILHEQAEDKRLVNFRRVYPVPSHHIMYPKKKQQQQEGQPQNGVPSQSESASAVSGQQKQRAPENLIPKTELISDINEQIEAMATAEDTAMKRIIYEEVLQFAVASNAMPTTASQEQRQNEIRQQRLKREQEAQLLAMKMPKNINTGGNANAGGAPARAFSQPPPSTSLRNAPTGGNAVSGASSSSSLPALTSRSQRTGANLNANSTTAAVNGNTTQGGGDYHHQPSDTPQPLTRSGSARFYPSGLPRKQPVPPPPRAPNSGGGVFNENELNKNDANTAGELSHSAVVPSSQQEKEERIAAERRKRQIRLEEQMARHRRRMELGPRVSVFQIREANAYVNEGILPGQQQNTLYTQPQQQQQYYVISSPTGQYASANNEAGIGPGTSSNSSSELALQGTYLHAQQTRPNRTVVGAPIAALVHQTGGSTTNLSSSGTNGGNFENRSQPTQTKEKGANSSHSSSVHPIRLSGSTIVTSAATQIQPGSSNSGTYGPTNNDNIVLASSAEGVPQAISHYGGGASLSLTAKRVLPQSSTAIQIERDPLEGMSDAENNGNQNNNNSNNGAFEFDDEANNYEDDGDDDDDERYRYRGYEGKTAEEKRVLRRFYALRNTMQCEEEEEEEEE